jgi:triacylglycerol lipase
MAQQTGYPAPTWHPADLPTLRAAYSDRTAALMAYLAAFAYNLQVEAIPATSVPSELTQLGFVRFSSFHNNMTNGYAYVAEGPDLVVLSFRGTQSKQDWDTDFHDALVHPPGTDVNLRVHGGFYNAFARLSDGTTGIGEKIAQIKSATNKRIPIYITGHSLGGALAQIASAVFADDQIAACYTYGSPRVGNVYFDSWVKPPSYRVMNYADIVPEFPLPFVYRHSGDARYMPDVVLDSPYRFQPNIFERTWQLVRGIVQLIRAGSILGIEDHRIGEYCRKLDQIADARRQGR